MLLHGMLVDWCVFANDDDELSCTSKHVKPYLKEMLAFVAPHPSMVWRQLDLQARLGGTFSFNRVRPIGL